MRIPRLTATGLAYPSPYCNGKPTGYLSLTAVGCITLPAIKLGVMARVPKLAQLATPFKLTHVGCSDRIMVGFRGLAPM